MYHSWLFNLLTYSIQQSPSWEADWFSASQEIPPHFMEPQSSLLHTQVPATCPYPEPDQSSPCLHHTFWRYILILSSLLCLGLPSVLFPSGFPTKTRCTRLFSPICATWLTHLIFLDLVSRATLREQCRSFSSSLCSFLHSLLPRPSLAQIFPSAPYFETPSACVPPSVSATKFHTHTKQQAEL